MKRHYDQFWAIPKEVMAMKELTLQSRAIYGIIYTRANGDNEAWPSQESISRDLGIGERSIRRYLGELAKKNLIVVARRGLGRSNLYTIPAANMADQDRQDMSAPERPPVSALSMKRTKENNNTISPEEFFESVDHQQNVIVWLQTKGLTPIVAKQEVAKFHAYWTEPSKTNSHVRWQGEKYFDVRRRLATWFSNVKKFAPRVAAIKTTEFIR